MFEANSRFFIQSFALGAGTLATSQTADRATAERKFIWPLAAILMLIGLGWALATEVRLPPEQRVAVFVVQSQAYP